MAVVGISVGSHRYAFANTLDGMIGLGALPPSGDRAEPCEDRPHTHAGGIPRAALEQGGRSSQTKLHFPPSAFHISSSFGSRRRINIRRLPLSALGPRGRGAGSG